MAFSKSLSGDRWSLTHIGTVVPKTFSASYTAPTPAVGHLVKRDPAINDGVLRCASTEEPYGMVLSINSAWCWSTTSRRRGAIVSPPTGRQASSRLMASCATRSSPTTQMAWGLWLP